MIFGFSFNAKGKEYLKSYQFPTTLISKLQELHPHLQGKDIVEVLDQLKVYFSLHINSRKDYAMPSKVVDDAWHQFILHTKDYAEFCDKAFGYFLHHNPNEKNSGWKSQDDNTWEATCKLESIIPEFPRRLPRIYSIDMDLKIPGQKWELAAITKLIRKPSYSDRNYFEKSNNTRITSSKKKDSSRSSNSSAADVGFLGSIFSASCSSASSCSSGSSSGGSSCSSGSSCGSSCGGGCGGGCGS